MPAGETQGHTYARMVLLPVTGLFDIPLLPALFAPVEDMASKLQLLQVAFRLAARTGTRPLSICFDDLDPSWTVVAAALQTSFPALVRLRFVASWNPLSADDLQFVEEGEFILDKFHFAAWGVGWARTRSMCIFV